MAANLEKTTPTAQRIVAHVLLVTNFVVDVSMPADRTVNRVVITLTMNVGLEALLFARQLQVRNQSAVVVAVALVREDTGNVI